MNEQRKNHAQPRLIDVRKPLRPVRVAAIRLPIKTTAPIVPGAGPSMPKRFGAR